MTFELRIFENANCTLCAIETGQGWDAAKGEGGISRATSAIIATDGALVGFAPWAADSPMAIAAASAERIT